MSNIKDLPNLDKAILHLLESHDEDLGVMKEVDETAESAIKKALLEASDLSEFNESDSFFLTESEVSTLMDNSRLLREKLSETDREREKLADQVKSLESELTVALKEEKVNV